MISNSGYLNNLLKIFLFFSIFFISESLSAQTGTISGSLKDSVTSEVIVGAIIRVEGTELGAASEPDGSYLITDVPPGNYTVVIDYIGYESLKLQDIKVEAGKDVVLKPIALKIIELKEVKVKARRTTNTSAAVVEEIKKSDVVSNGISSQEINRNQDRDASQAIRRISGITLMDNRFVNIRGLNERYNTTLVNGLIAPSTEADIKAFSFDMLSTNMIDRVMVYKTASPDQQGEFAGGIVNIHTAGIPERFTLKLNYNDGYANGTTTETFLAQKQGEKFWLGSDDGTYTLDSDFPAKSKMNLNQPFKTRQEYLSLKQNNSIAKQKLGASFFADSIKSPLDQRLNGSVGFSFKMFKKLRIGAISAFNYSNTRNTIHSTISGYNPESEQNKAGFDTIYSFRNNDFQQNVRIGLMGNVGIYLGKNHSVEFKNVYNRLASSRYVFRTGRNDNDQLTKTDIFSNLYRTIEMNQLIGKHTPIEGLTFDWALGYSQAERNEPDVRAFTQFKNVTDADSIPYQNLVYGPAGGSPQDFGRLFFNTVEYTRDISLNLEYILKIGAFKPAIKGGYYGSDKSRKFALRAFTYGTSKPNVVFNIGKDSLFSPKYYNDPEYLAVKDITDSSDQYNAQNFLNAYYLSFKLPYKKFTVFTGLRVEENVQKIQGKENVGEGGDTINVSNNTLFKLPSVNLSYDLNDKHKFRVAYGKTLNRAILRELSPVTYYDFYQYAQFRGNPFLKTAAVQNYDLRYEFYPSPGETFSIGPFYKTFVNPIEAYQVNSTTQIFSYRNADRAKAYGVEVEIRKKIGTIFKSDNFLDYFGLVVNGSLIRSEVTATGDQLFLPRTDKRPLQGQSPYVFNAGLYYDNDTTGLTVNLVYNVFGPRISIVGTKAVNGSNSQYDIIEQSRRQLDFTVSKRFFKYVVVRASIQNILNDPFRLVYDSNDDHKITNKDVNGDGISDVDPVYTSFKLGQYFTFGLGITF